MRRLILLAKSVKNFSGLMVILATTLVAFPTFVSAEFFRDVIVTSPNGIWTDSRAYTTLQDAINVVGADEREIIIAKQEVCTTLTIPSNVRLKFTRGGSIANSGNLTINTKDIDAGNYQIFTGVGNIDFAAGAIVKSGWFPNVESAFALTTNDTVTLVISKPQSITASYSPGDDVTLKWEAPGNILSVNAGVVVGNLKNIEAGDYQLFAGDGDFDFLDGAQLKLSWFRRLRSVLNWVENEKVTIHITEPSTVSYTNIVDSNESLRIYNGGILNLNGGVTLTINSQPIAGPYQIFSGGTIAFGIKHIYVKWLNNDLQAAFDSLSAIGGGKIEVTESFSIASTITVPVGDKFYVLEGKGLGTKITFTAVDGSNMFDIPGTVANRAYLWIDKLYLRGNALAGICINGSYMQPLGFRLTEVIIESFGNDGINLDNSYGAVIDGTTMINACNQNAGVAAIQLSVCSNSKISSVIQSSYEKGIYLYNCSSTTINGIIQTLDSDFLTFDNCQGGNVSGAHFESSSADPPNLIVIKGGTTGIDISGNSISRSSDITGGGTKAPIYIDTSYGINIEGNTISPSDGAINNVPHAIVTANAVNITFGRNFYKGYRLLPPTVPILDIASGAKNIQCSFLAPKTYRFIRENVPANTNKGSLYLEIGAGAMVTNPRLPWKSWIVGIRAYANTNVTADQILVEVTDVGGYATMDAVITNGNNYSMSKQWPFVAGEYVAKNAQMLCVFTTGVGYTPTTLDLVVEVDVLEDREDY